MKKIFSISLLIFVAQFALAQADEKESPLRDMKFRNVGPAGMSGRVTSVDVDLKNEQIIYAGTASGGLWRSESGGQAWESIFDHEATANIGVVKINQQNTDVIWVGTGEGNPRNSHNTGKGIYKSIDRGKTWKLMGLENTRNIHRIIIHPQNADIIYVAAIGVAWGESEDRGVFKTTDGGQTWNKILYVNPKTGAADLVMDHQNPDKLMVSMWEYRRWPWFFKSGGEGSGLYVTFDSGKNWTKRTDKDGLPKGELGRIGLALSKSNPKVAYALVENKEKNALYKSTDGGFKWNRISDNPNIGNRPFYYSDIYVDPNNEDIIYSLWTFLSKSKDGGKTWTKVPYTTIHPDHHAFWQHPEKSNFLIEGNDGGMNISRDAGKTWRFVENLPLAQFYHINIDNELPYNIYGGMQDNGSWVGPAYTWKSGGIRNAQWQEIFFGDGFDVVPDPDDVRWIYAMSQGGNVARIDKETGNKKTVKPRHPDGVKLRFNWNAAIAQDPFDNSTIYFGSQFVHKSTNKGNDWEVISPDLTTNDTAYQKQLESGGLTYDVTGAENYTTILAIAPSALKQGEIWASTDDGKLHVTKDGGENWKDISGALKGAPEGAWIPFLHVSEYNEGEAFVVVNDYRRDHWAPYIFYTTNYGKSFTNIAVAEVMKSFCLSVIQDPVEENLLFAGCDDGLFYSLDKGANWKKWGDDFPTVQVSDLKIQKREKDLIVGTFGRAAWVLDDLEPLRQLANNESKTDENTLTVFAPPTAYQANYLNASGTRFAGHALYKGQNRAGGARLSFWVNIPENDSVLKKIKKVTLEIYNADGEKVRTLKRDYHDGLNRTHWGLGGKGVFYPQRKERSKKDWENEPGGNAVLPGKYKLVFTLGENKDSTEIDVQFDPRVDISLTELKLLQDYFLKVQVWVTAMDSATYRLNKIQNNLKTLSALAKNIEEDSLRKDYEKRIKTLNDSINELEIMVFGKENVKGYFDQPETWYSAQGEVMSYAWLNKGKPTQSQEIVLKEFEGTSAKALHKINTFIAQDWEGFKSFVKENPLPMFEEIKTTKD